MIGSLRAGVVPLLLVASLCFRPAQGQVVYGWLGQDGGFRDPTKWLPNGVPSGADWASFLLAVPSNVSFDANVSNALLNVGAGDVTFGLAGHTYSLTNSSEAYPYSINVGTMEEWAGGLTLLGGTLNGVNSVVGAIYGSWGLVTVDAGATWHNTGHLCVAYGGAGTLTVQNGGRLDCAGGTLGLLGGSVAAATVTGTDSTWTTGPLHVGEWGMAALAVQDGASLQTGDACLGHSLTGDGAVTVTGAGSTWEAPNLYVGGTDAAVAGAGALTVSSGGAVDVGGMVRVWRTVSLENGGLLVADQLWRGPAGAVTMAAGSTLRVNDLVGFGDNPSFGGGLEIAHGPTISSSYTVAGGQSLSVGDALTVGYDGFGMLTISGGGMVTSGSGILGRILYSDGGVIIRDPGSSWTISEGLFLGGSDAQGGGSATLYVRGGAEVTVGGVVKLWPDGHLTISDGGHVTAGSFENAGGRLAWPSGSLRFLADLTIDSTDPFGMGEELRLGSERTLGVCGTLTLDGPGTVWLDGGRLECGALESVDGGSLRWDSGTLACPTGACVSCADPFCAVGGSAVTPGRTLEVTDLLEVAAGGVLALDGGVIQADRLARSGGELAFHHGTCEVRDRLDMGADACVLGGGEDDDVRVIVGEGADEPPVVAFRDLTLARSVEMTVYGYLDGEGAAGITMGGSGGAGGRLAVSGGELTVRESLNVGGGEGGYAGDWQDAQGGPGGTVNVSGGVLTVQGALHARGGHGAPGDFRAPESGGPGGSGGEVVVSDGLTDLRGGGDVGGGDGGRYGGDGGAGGTLTVNGGAMMLGGTWSLRGGGAGECPWSSPSGFWQAGGGSGGRLHVAGGTVTVLPGGTLDARGGSGGPSYAVHGFPSSVPGGAGGAGGRLDVSGGLVVLGGTVDLRGGVGGQGHDGTNPPAGEGGPGGPGGRIRLWSGELVLQPGCRIDLAGGEGGPGGAGNPDAPPGIPGEPGALEMSGGTLTVDASAFDAMFVAGSLSYTGGSFHLTDVNGFAVGQSTGQIAAALGGSHVHRSAGNDLTVDEKLTVAAGASLQVDGGRVRADEIELAGGATLRLDAGRVEAEYLIRPPDATFAFTGGELRVIEYKGDLVNDGGAIRLSPPGECWDIAGMVVEGDLAMNAGAVESWVIPLGEQLDSTRNFSVGVLGDVALGGALALRWAQVPAAGLGIRQGFGGPYDVLYYLGERSGQFTSFAEPGTSGELAADSGDSLLLSTIGERYVAGVDYEVEVEGYPDVHAVRVELYDLLDGDCNVDGCVDREDLDALEAGFGSPEPTWFDGDVNYDGTVDHTDYLLWKANAGASVPGGAAPEPATLALLAFGGLVLLCRKRSL